MLGKSLAALGIVLAMSCVATTARGAEEGLIAQFPLDEGIGTSTRDATGGGITGTLHNTEWAKWGKADALKLRRADSYVEIGAGLKEKLVGDFTLAAWVKLAATPFPDPSTNWSILACEDYDGKPSPQNGFMFRIAGDSVQPYFRSCQPGVAEDFTLGTAMQNNKPYLVAVVKKGGAARIYLNGVAGPEFPVKDPAPGPAPLLIGGGGQSFGGMIGDVRFYNRALSEKEMKELYDRTVAERSKE